MNATGRGRRDGSLIPLVPPGGTPLAGSLLVVSKQSRATRVPPAGNWVRFSCSIPRLFVLSHNMPMINTTGKLGSFWRFSITAGSLRSDSLATILSLHAPCPRPTSGDRSCADPPRWLLPATDSQIVKDRTGPDLDERPVYIEYVTKPGDSYGKINPFPPLASARSLTTLSRARSREVFTFHRPEELLRLVSLDAQVRGKLKAFPALDSSKLWSVQKRAIENLERSLAKNNPRSLIQMATGSGKTFTAVNDCYRLTSSAGRGGCCSSWTAATLGGRPTGSSSSS